MFVIKRDGERETVNFSKITARIKKLCYEIDKTVDANKVAQKVIEGMKDGITTTEIDNLASEQCATMATIHPDYSILASRIAVTNLHKNTYKHFSTVAKHLYEFKDSNGKHSPLISQETYRTIEKHSSQLDSAIIYDRDFNFDYFGFKTLEKSYLLRIDGKVAERPQHLFMRVAVGIHGRDIDKAIETYNLMSEGWFTHATPTLFNAGTPKPQMSSCFLVAMKDDSISGIYDTLKICAEISKHAGGIGLHVHNIRAAGSYIRGTNGVSNGLVPMLKVFNETARYVDQGGGKRKGSFAIYLEPWHADVFEFLDLRRPHGKEELKARDLFTALWIPDLFMKRVEEDKEWTLFCPDEAKGLSDLCGEAFEKRYLHYENAKMGKRIVKARDLWERIITSQIETGTPYLLYKDACNLKSNQKNLGPIKSSNLCTEIIQYSSPEEVAVCNLASISLPKFIVEGKFDHQKLFEITQIVTKNLNKVIDLNYYPVKEAERSNFKHRPIGIGVQGLADTFIKLRMVFDSEEALKLNKEIFETIYYGALVASKDLSKKDGHYESYKGSPISEGIFQFDMWGITPSPRWDWEKLREGIKKHGVRNSLLLAPMPTASTSQILGNNECIEPITTNLYTRRVLSGEFIIVNKYLLKDLIDLKLWNNEMKERLIMANGSVQNLPIPDELKKIYRTVWEIPQKSLIDMSADRGAFICQSQSLNLFVDNPTYAKLTSMHFYAWKKGLKTGVYYVRIQSARDPIKVSISSVTSETASCRIDDPSCVTCTS